VSDVLVVAAHPDDEAFGCGGSLCRDVAAGARVHEIALTSGEQGGHGIEQAGQVREAEAREAAGILGLQAIEFWRQPDGRLRASRELVERLRQRLEQLRPETVYAPHERDDHPDHQAAARLVMRAARALRSPPRLRMFEIWTPIEQIDEVIDITEHLERKVAAIRAYRSQGSVMRFDEAFTGLSRFRGEMHSWPGGDHAEVFRCPQL